jgi:glucose/arabinose dehydrogenase
MRTPASRGGLCAAVLACAGAAWGQSLTTQVLTSALVRPLWAVSPPGDLRRFFIVEQRGSAGIATRADIRILDLTNNTLNLTPFLSVLGVSTGSEQGLLGLAFSPNYASDGFFFVNYTNSAGTSIVARYHVSANPDVADPASATTVLTVAQPFSNHNGGWLDFGPDGYLYLGFGDGGSAGDPQANGQNKNVLLGKILRLDVSTLPYQIPPTNPFVGVPNTRPEIWAYGVRNPWRPAFDRETGDLWIADVGQDNWEEINFQPRLLDPPFPVQNYGWRCYEGNAAFNLTNCDAASTMHFPVYVYPHSGAGCRGSITGGFVYRGCAMPWLRGEYFFADYCFNTISSFRYTGVPVTSVTSRTAELQPTGGPAIIGPTSFAQDQNGELYICAGASLYKIVPRCPANCDGSTSAPVLNVNDFVCFQSRFAAGDCYANCDGSTSPPVLNVNDFVCFTSIFAAGCP